LIKNRGHCCEVCRLTEWQQKRIPLELDHIDGNPENNAIDNLRLICPNCHAQTPNYKGKNIGKVRNSKRAAKLKRYGSYR
jgi:5-methylcytosine-specific restriction endonuclease McrA